MSASRCREFESMRGQALPLRRRSRRPDPLQQHVRVAEDGVERRTELVRDIGQELRLERRRLLELDVLPSQQLVLLRELGGRFLDLALELGRGLASAAQRDAPCRWPR